MKPDCAYCGCKEKDHCKGGERHSNYKDAMRMNPRPRVHVCTNRHCESPLCCCTNYIDPSPKIEPEVIPPWEAGCREEAAEAMQLEPPMNVIRDSISEEENKEESVAYIFDIP